MGPVNYSGSPLDLQKLLLGRQPSANEAHWRKRLANQGEIKKPKKTAESATHDFLAAQLRKVTNERRAERLAAKATGLADALTPAGNVYMAQDGAAQAQRGGLVNALLGGGQIALAALPAGASAARGARAFATEVGYHLKDVKPYQPASWREFNRASDNGDWTEVEVPLRALYGAQPHVNSDFVEAAARAASRDDGFGLPIVVRHGGELFVRDGHHRLVAASSAGRQTARVRLIDFDGQQPAPLLDLMK